MSTFATLYAGAIDAGLFLIGGIALLCPRTVQRWALDFYEAAPRLARWNPYLDWMRTSSYLTSLRLMGILSLAGAVLVAWALMHPNSKP